MIRKERPVAGGGGVFVALHSKYIASHESSFDSDSEILWVKLNIQGSKPLYIGCYYRPTDRNRRPIYTRRKKWNGSDKKWNGSAKFSSVNRILSVPFVPDPFLKRTATGCGPFQERIG